MEYRVIELLQEIKSLIMGKPKQERWIGINEASKYAGCSSQTLRRNIKSGSLKASTRTGKILLKPSQVESWLNG